MKKRELLFLIRFKNQAKQQLGQLKNQLRAVGIAAGTMVKTGLKRASAALTKLAVKAQLVGKRMMAFGNRMREVGSIVTLGVSGPIAALGFGVLKASGSFEQSMNRVQAVSGATANEFEALKTKAKDLGATTAFTATQAGDGLLFLAKTGLSVKEQLGAITPSLNLASASGIQLADSANIVTNVLKGLQLPVGQLPFAVDVLSKAFVSSNVDVTQLGQAFKKVGPVATQFNQDFTSMTAILGALGDAGIQGGEAGTALRRVLLNLTTDSAKTKGILSSVGVSITGVDGKMRSLVDIFDDLGKVTLTNEQRIKLFGARGIAAAGIILDRGTESLVKFRNELENAGGTAKRLQDVQLKGLVGALRKLKSAAEGLAIAIGEAGVTESFTNFINKVTAVIRKLRTLDKSILRNIAKWALIIGAIGPVIAIFGVFFAIVGSAISGIGLLAKAFLSLGKAVIFLGKSFAGALLALGPTGWIIVGIIAIIAILAHFTDSWDVVGRVIKFVVNGIIKAVLILFAIWKTEFRIAAQIVKNLTEIVKEQFAKIVDFIQPFVNFFVEGFARIGNFIGELFGKLGEKFGGFFGGVADQVGELAGKVGVLLQPAVDKVKGLLFGDPDEETIFEKVFKGTGEAARKGLTEIQEIIASDPTGELLKAFKDFFKIKIPKLAGEGGEKAGEEFVEQVKRVVEAADPSLFERLFAEGAFLGDLFSGAKEGFNDLVAQMVDTKKQAKEAFETLADEVGTTLEKLVTTGKANFAELGKSILRELAKIAANRLLAQLLGQGVKLLGSLGGGLSGAIAGGGQGITGAGIMGADAGLVNTVSQGQILTTIAKRGGLAEQLPIGGLVPAQVFQNAKRFQFGGQVGTGRDTIPALLRPGERVLTPEQQQAGQRPINVTVNITATDVESFRRSQGQVQAEIAAGLARAQARDG